MLNLTILSFVSSISFSHSPAFVGNRMEFNKGNLNRITSLYFYNQQNLLLTNSIFDKTLNGIVLNNVNDQYQHDTHFNLTFQGEYLFLIDPEPKRSVSIIECTFKDINAKYAISINSEYVSLYITKCLYLNCRSSENGVVNIGKCRCLTISHVCCSEAYSHKEGGSFLVSYCAENDFSIVIYNSVVDSSSDSSNSYVFYPHYGNQYFRCNNVTNCNQGGFQFEAIKCFSFAMNTVVDCFNCFQFSGNIETEKIIEKCNVISKRNLFILSGNIETSIKVFDCVLIWLEIENNGKFGIEYRDTNKLSISFINCMISNNVKDDSASFDDCTTKNKDEITKRVIPHFTYQNICLGEIHQHENAAFGCNAGHCIDNNCNSTIGFPDDVVPYTTFIYGDLQTKTFSPTESFTKSEYFSDSQLFSKSNQFTKSHVFSDSEVFSMSNIFLNNDDGSKSEDDDKGLKPAVIGAIVGVVVAAAIAAIVAFIFIRKRRRMVYLTSDPNIIETNDSSLTVQNNLDNIMDEDDPFAEEFK